MKKKASKGKGTKPLSVRESVAVRFGGPADLEFSAREAFEAYVASWLRAACPRFAKTRQPEIQAARIVGNIPYAVAKRPVLDVRKLDVDYQNDRASGAHGRWKVWTRVENWTDTAQGQAGAFASSFGKPGKSKKTSSAKKVRARKQAKSRKKTKK